MRRWMYVLLGLVVCCALPMLARDTGPSLADGPRNVRGAASVAPDLPGGDEMPDDLGSCCFDLLGDTTWDGTVSWEDVHVVAMLYYAQKGDGRYDWRGDVNCDGRVGPLDLQLVLMQLCGAQ